MLVFSACDPTRSISSIRYATAVWVEQLPSSTVSHTAGFPVITTAAIARTTPARSHDRVATERISPPGCSTCLVGDRIEVPSIGSGAWRRIAQ
jgi:hypothetical protein